MKQVAERILVTFILVMLLIGNLSNPVSAAFATSDQWSEGITNEESTALKEMGAALPSGITGAVQAEMIIFSGARNLEIEVVRGEQFGDRLPRQIFEEATWEFHLDGTFRFSPSETANVRSDLFPIEGTYVKVNDTFEFHGERR